MGDSNKNRAASYGANGRIWARPTTMCAEAFPPLTARPRARARRGLCKLFVDAESFSGDMYKAQSDYDDLTLTLKQAEDQVALLEFEKQCDWCQPPRRPCSLHCICAPRL